MTRKATLLAMTFAIVLTASAAHAQLTFQTYASGFTMPLAFNGDPTNSNRQFVVQQDGRIRPIVNGVVQGTDFIDIGDRISTGGERGLLGMAFDPGYASNGFVYLNYTDVAGNTQISRFTRSGSGLLDPNTEFKILSVAQPFENHNGGTLRFGSDGLLYIGMGDGGSANDPGNRAQDPNTLLGKMLRIDVTRDDFGGDPDRNYGIPLDNPFVDNDPVDAMDEIWAFGLRNPFKWSFDSFGSGATNALIIGDVGQGDWEEVDYQRAGLGGLNYGWRLREGMHDTNPGPAAYFPLTDPVHEYLHGDGATVIGGAVYRGSALGSAYAGKYFFADFIQGRLWSMRFNLDGAGNATGVSDLVEHTAELAPLGMISSIDIDHEGELYMTDYTGRLLKLQAVPEPATMAALGLGLVAVVARRRRRRA